MNTFSYCGIDSSAFNCYYVPDESTRFDDRVDFDVYDDTSEWHDGGRYYGNKVKQREFSMECYYEQVSIKTKEKIMAWLDRKTYGKLVFDLWPWKYYMVRPTKKLDGKNYTYRTNGASEDVCSGTFTVTFTAYEPFAYIDVNKLDDSAKNYLNILDSGITPSAPTTSSRRFYIYNCGTEKAYPIIRIGGTVGESGLTITNELNGTSCKLIDLPPTSTYLQIDCGKCLVTLVNGSATSTQFSYHDLGYISLEPGGILMDTVNVTYTSGSNIVQFDKTFDSDDIINKVIRFNNAWYGITDVTSEGIIISRNASASGTQETNIYNMNTIVLTGSSISLNKLEMEFIPRMQ